MGYARHSSEVMVAAGNGIENAWATRRLLAGQQEDGERMRKSKGSPTNRKVDATEDSQLLEVENNDDPMLNQDLGRQIGRRSGKKRSRYLS